MKSTTPQAHSMDHPMRTLALLLLAAVLAGCGSGTAELQAYVADVKSRPGPPLDPLPVMQQFETFEYDAFDLRDPFSMPREERATGAGEGPRPDENRRRELLESYPLDGLSMVGTIGTGSDMVALMLDPEGVVHRVKEGNYMGQNEGRIVRIAAGRVDLIELVPDGAGGWLERQASVALDGQ
jgi:type IV pilus assembly protein PilP